MATPPFPDHYRTLGVHRHAEPEVIAAAYRALARRYHPDLNREPDAADRFRGIREAYEVLSEPARRAVYDRAWDAHHAPRPGPSAAPPPPPTPPRWGDYSGSSRRPPPPPPEPAPVRTRRPWFQGVVGLFLLLGLCRGAAWIGDRMNDGDGGPAGRNVRSTVVAEATTIAGQVPRPVFGAIGTGTDGLTPTPTPGGAGSCEGWNGWVDRMEAIAPRYDAAMATANADTFPTAFEYAQRADEMQALARAVRGTNPPPAAAGYVERQAAYLLSLFYAFRAASQGEDAGRYYDGADLDFTEAERLRAEANLACAGGTGT